LLERSIIGILPKARFYPLFESLQHRPESRVIGLDPDGKSDIERITASEEESHGEEISVSWRRGRVNLHSHQPSEPGLNVTLAG